MAAMTNDPRIAQALLMVARGESSTVQQQCETSFVHGPTQKLFGTSAGGTAVDATEGVPRYPHMFIILVVYIWRRRS